MAISEQALIKVRRRKAARRLFRDMPLFAYDTINTRTQIPYTSIDEFWADLPIKTKRRREKYKKSPLVRYGRYEEMQRLIWMWEQTGDVDQLLKAQKLRKVMTQPYRMIVQKNGKQDQWQFPATTPYRDMVRLNALAKQCQSVDEFASRHTEIIRQVSMGK